jgi:hypothetical protein
MLDWWRSKLVSGRFETIFESGIKMPRSGKFEQQHSRISHVKRTAVTTLKPRGQACCDINKKTSGTLSELGACLCESYRGSSNARP